MNPVPPVALEEQETPEAPEEQEGREPRIIPRPARASPAGSARGEVVGTLHH